MVDPEPAAPRTDRVEAFGRTIAKYATIVTVFISAAVPLTEWVRGFTNQKIKASSGNRVGDFGGETRREACG